MNYAAIPVTTTSAHRLVGNGDAASIGTWLRLCMACVSDDVESPRVPDAASWSDARWRLFATTSRQEVETVVEAGLARWDGADLEVDGFDAGRIARARRLREIGKQAAETLRRVASPAYSPRKMLDGARGHTIERLRLTEAEAAQLAAITTELARAGILASRPRTLAECLPGPCPWVSCKYHLYLDVDPDTGAIKLNFPDREPWELAETCAMRVARRDDMEDAAEVLPLDQVGALVNITLEGVRKIEARALAKGRQDMDLVRIKRNAPG